MTTNYDAPFKELYEEISQFSPSALPVLEQINRSCGSQIGYYAAFVLICLRGRQESHARLAAFEATSEDLKDFTFFEVAKDNPVAIDLFDQLLNCYQSEQSAGQS